MNIFRSIFLTLYNFPTDMEKIDLSTDDNFQDTAVDTSSSSGFGSANSSIKKSKFSWHTAESFNL